MLKLGQAQTGSTASLPDKDWKVRSLEDDIKRRRVGALGLEGTGFRVVTICLASSKLRSASEEISSRDGGGSEGTACSALKETSFLSPFTSGVALGLKVGSRSKGRASVASSEYTCISGEDSMSRSKVGSMEDVSSASVVGLGLAIVEGVDLIVVGGAGLVLVVVVGTGFVTVVGLGVVVGVRVVVDAGIGTVVGVGLLVVSAGLVVVRARPVAEVRVRMVVVGASLAIVVGLGFVVMVGIVVSSESTLGSDERQRGPGVSIRAA